MNRCSACHLRFLPFSWTRSRKKLKTCHTNRAIKIKKNKNKVKITKVSVQWDRAHTGEQKSNTKYSGRHTVHHLTPNHWGNAGDLKINQAIWGCCNIDKQLVASGVVWMLCHWTVPKPPLVLCTESELFIDPAACLIFYPYKITPWQTKQVRLQIHIF